MRKRVRKLIAHLKLIILQQNEKRLCISLLILFISLNISAQYTNIINFTGDTGSYNGADPVGSLILAGDTLYGMTENGGSHGYGNIFSVQKNGTNYRNLIDFAGDTGSYIGAYPQGSLLLIGNTLYGMTGKGGMLGWGSIFSVQTNGTNFKNLINFTRSSGSYIGAYPNGSLILSGDTLYGMTYNGGLYIYGNIFSVQIDGTNFKDLIDFTGTAGAYPGNAPYGSLIISADTLYGMTVLGGGYGNIFSVQTNGTNYKNLINFTGRTGSYPGEYPHGSLTLLGDTLYGMTELGGTIGGGNIFSVRTDGTNYNNLINFTGSSGSYIGAYPFTTILIPKGETLYGMTYHGGINSYGNIFSVQINGANYKDAIEFTGKTGPYIGYQPLGSLILSKDTFYGMTSEGGLNGYGNIFSFIDTSITTPVNKLSVVSSHWLIYPNPNNGLFTIALQNLNELAQVEFYNVLGEKIYQAKINADKTEINIGTQPQGIYFYRILNESGGLVGSGKLIIEK